jgi:acetyl esterase/lipase
MTPVYTDMKYGPYERNVLDVYLPDRTEGPSPAVIYLHGGGYIHGDKINVQTIPLMEECLSQGIAVISANYRFITQHPFPAPMNDGTRVIQFVRRKAPEWNIDPQLIALSGTSAGAHISLWNAFRGDLSDPHSDDPVARVSSAVCAVVAFEAQASKDQHFYKDIYLGSKIQPNITLFYGIEKTEDLERPDIRKLSYEASAINFITEKAPPVLLSYRREFTPVPIAADIPVDHLIHHPVHGYMLKQKMESFGRKCIFRHPGDPLQEGEALRFLQDAFAAAKSGEQQG